MPDQPKQQRRSDPRSGKGSDVTGSLIDHNLITNPSDEARHKNGGRIRQRRRIPDGAKRKSEPWPNCGGRLGRTDSKVTVDMRIESRFRI
jgi:hypothetical protein